MEQTIESSFDKIRKRIEEEKQRAGQHLVSESVTEDGRLTRRVWSSAKPDATQENDVPQDLAEFCRLHSKGMLDVAKVAERKDYLAPSGLLKVLDSAVETAATDQEREQIVTFVKRLSRMILGSSEEYYKQRFIVALGDADPGLFFPFCRKAAMSQEAGVHFYSALCEELGRRIPARADIVERISVFAARRMIGDQSARTPLLYGPPGAGKSELANQFAAAATAAGLPAAAVFQSLTQDGNRDEQVDMALLGTSLHYSNGATGLVYDTVKDPTLRLGVVVLDEADKTGNRDYLVGLLDPKNPLQDHFVREVAKEQDMRHKCLFILTANDATRLGEGSDDPLWSRLDPIYLRPYEIEELVELGVTVLTASDNALYSPSTELARSIVREALSELGHNTSFRAVLDRANEKLFYELMHSVDNALRNRRQAPAATGLAVPAAQRRTIGFRN